MYIGYCSLKVKKVMLNKEYKENSPEYIFWINKLFLYLDMQSIITKKNYELQELKDK